MDFECRQKFDHYKFCAWKIIPSTEFEKWLKKRRLSGKFEKELTERKKEENSMRKSEKIVQNGSNQRDIEQKNSKKNQNRQSISSSNRYVYLSTQ